MDRWTLRRIGWIQKGKQQKMPYKAEDKRTAQFLSSKQQCPVERNGQIKGESKVIFSSHAFTRQSALQQIF